MDQMDPRQIALVQTSFASIAPQASHLARQFYDRLFELDPTLRPLFSGDMAKQGLKLMATLQLAVNALRDVEQIVPALRRLGRNHRAYGVADAHYATVGAALLWALEQSLQEQFTRELRDAWAAAYAVLSGAMREAAAELPLDAAA
jgi:hemoglobin-like flavoprotein